MSARLACFTAVLAVARLVSAQTVSPGPPAEDVFRAIRSNDLAALRLLSKSEDALQVRDRFGLTPLHYAATYGSTDAVRILVEAGSDVNARNNREVTPLIYAAWDLEKTRLIAERHADVNAHSRDGITALMVACSVHGNAATVRYLLDKGADTKALNSTGMDALETAAEKGDPEMITLLLAKGADPRHRDNFNTTALQRAFGGRGSETAGLLIAAGADVNSANTFTGAARNGPIALIHETPLLKAAPGGDASRIALLLKAGAHADQFDIRKMTPLMLAVATDKASPEEIKQLIAAGADVNAKDIYGDSVLDWALKFRQPAIVAMLEKAGAKINRPPSPPAHPDFTAPSPVDAIERASALLATSAETFFPEGGGCVSCHHQTLIASAYAAVLHARMFPEDRMKQIFRQGMIPEGNGNASELPLMLGQGGDYDRLLYEIQAMADLGDPANATTDAIVAYLAARQDPSGAWINLDGPRTPLQSSSVVRTAMSIRALKTYSLPARSREFEQRIAGAQKWLTEAAPRNSYEQAYRLMGLHAAGKTASELAGSAKTLLTQQQKDGGWSQNPWLAPDAWATSMALASLYEAGLLRPTDDAYQRGVRYLLRTQFPDGSWYVASRSPKIQPYFESGFPYGNDQWISVAATAWAVKALAPAASLR